MVDKKLMSTVKSVLVTGGTGSFGKEFVRRILEIAPDIERLVIFSRDELKQFEMAQVFSPERYPALRYFIGDVRDEGRLRRNLVRVVKVPVLFRRDEREMRLVEADRKEERLVRWQRRHLGD